MVSPQYELSYVYQKHSSVKKFSHKGCIAMVSPQYEFSHWLHGYIGTSDQKLGHPNAYHHGKNSSINCHLMFQIIISKLPKNSTTSIEIATPQN